MSLTTPPDADEQARALKRLAGVQRRGRARRRYRFALAAAGGVIVVAGLGLSRTFTSAGTRHVRVVGPTDVPSPGLDIPSDAVPWADRPPGPDYSPPPPSTTLPPASSQPCSASQVKAIPTGRNGASGHIMYGYQLTNISSRTCLLAGYPGVVATEPGHASVAASQGTYVPDTGPPGDVAPGASSDLTIEVVSSCDAPSTFTTYHHVVVTLPGGGDIVLSGLSLTLACGLHVGAFALPVPLPEPVTSANPIAAITASLMVAPQQLEAGTTAIYAAVITNPTDAVITLDPCPNFLQYLSGTTVKDRHQLNCADAKPIPPHAQETFVMHIVVPDDAPDGHSTLSWNLFSPGGATATAMVEIRADPHRPAQPPP